MRKDHDADRGASEQAKAAGFEPTDVSAGSMLKWAIGLLVLMFGSMLTMLILYFVLGGSTRPGRSARTQELRLAPWPRLQANPIKDLRDFEREQQELASQYAWVDPGRGRVRIPVDRAMALVAEQGLPEWPQAVSFRGGGQ
jgi:hypothetical protein